MEIIAIANQKGGIGKTTTATNLASILQSRGFATLLIDADPQCNSTDTFRAKIKDTATLFDVLLDYDEPTSIDEAIQHTEIGDIVAGDPLLKEAETLFRPEAGEEYFRLKDAIVNMKKKYGYIIIDTAPADNKLLKNVLIAADEVIIPITADRYGVQGLAELNDTINTVRKRNNPNLKISGLLMVKYHEGYNLTKDVTESLVQIAEKLNTKVFKTKIRESTKAQQAQALRQTLIQFDQTDRNKVLNDYRDFVKELITEEKYYLIFDNRI